MMSRLPIEAICRRNWAELRHLPGRQVVVSVSGGKDSTATCLLMKYFGIPFRAVHLDTGWEHPDTDHYVREVLPQYIGEIEIAQHLPTLSPEDVKVAESFEARLSGRPSAMVRWILKKNMFPSRMRKWCTDYLKIKAFHGWSTRTFGKDMDAFICALGVRRAESTKRAQLPEWGFADGGYMEWRPLIHWTEREVFAMHMAFGVPANPLYHRGAGRVGCYPCIMCRKAEVRMVAETLPERIDLLRDLETAVTGRRLKFRAFFANPNYRRHLTQYRELAVTSGLTSEEDIEKFARDRTAAMARIDDVVAWSKTKRNGEPEPFAPLPHETGCSMLGHCDTGWTGRPD